MDKVKQGVEFEKYKDNYTLSNRLRRLSWNVTCFLFFRPFSLPCFKHWRSFMLKIWGAKIGKGSIVHASANIWAPWNLEVGKERASDLMQFSIIQEELLSVTRSQYHNTPICVRLHTITSRKTTPSIGNPSRLTTAHGLRRTHSSVLASPSAKVPSSEPAPPSSKMSNRGQLSAAIPPNSSRKESCAQKKQGLISLLSFDGRFLTSRLGV